MATVTVTETRPPMDVKPIPLAQPSQQPGGPSCPHWNPWLRAHHHLALERLRTATAASFQLEAPTAGTVSTSELLDERWKYPELIRPHLALFGRASGPVALVLLDLHSARTAPLFLPLVRADSLR